MPAVLMYHSIGAPEEGAYDVSAALFEQQMRIIAESGLPTQTIADAAKASQVDSVLVTFDDGHRTVLDQALPLLQEYGIAATVYVTTGYVGSDARWLDWDALKTLDDGQINLQTHGHSHRFLNTLPENELADEMRLPRKLLAERLGRDARHMALPGGRYNQRVIEMAEQAGYESVATSHPGIWSGPVSKSGLQLIDRYCITGFTQIADFKRMVSQDRFFAAKKSLAHSGKLMVRKLVGDRLYQRVWALKNRGAKT